MLFQSGILLSLYFLLYGSLISGLITDWKTDTYSYGFLVPFIAVYLLWQQVDILKDTPAVSSLWGCLTLSIAVTLYLFGQLAADTFTMRISMVIAVAALTQMTLGNRYLIALAFPLSYLFFMIPVPFLLVKKITNTLMFFDAALSARVIQFLGIPIFLDSNFLHLPEITLEVADVCSGISSVLALFVLGLVYSYFLPITSVWKVFLTVSTIPLAVTANLFRIIVTVVLTHYYGLIVLDSWFHKFHGTFNFMLSVSSLIALGEFLRRSCPCRVALVNRGEYRASRPARWAIAWKGTVAGALILCGAVYLSASIRTGEAAESKLQLDRLPMTFGNYRIAKAAWSDAYTDNNANKQLSRFYVDSRGLPVELFVGSTRTTANRLQSPKLVFPERWNYVWLRSAAIATNETEQIKANWMLTQRGNSKRVVLYWYQFGRETFTSEIYYRVASFKHRLLGGETAVVRIATPVLLGESIDDAQERVKKFILLASPDLRILFRAIR